MVNENIPVVLSADNNYALPLFVTFVSIIQSKQAETKYKFCFLVSDDFKDTYKNVINDIIFQNELPEARWINMKDAYKDAFIHVSHLSNAAYYRLQLPMLLAEEDYCVYLDVDTCVCHDLTELYNLRSENDYIIGVRAAGYYYPEDKVKRQLDMLQIAKFDRYINSGVMVMNLKKMRDDHLNIRFDELLECKFTSEDQDILNCACYPNIKIIAPKYNLMTKYPVEKIEDYDKEKCLKICYSREEWETAIVNPQIIHYADFRKPWLYLDEPLSGRWWHAFEQGLIYINKANLMFVDELVSFYKFTQQRHAMKENQERSKFEKKINSLQTENSEINKKLKQAYDDKSEINKKLKQACDDKSEINKKLKQTYEEKSEINRKLQQTYDEKAERGIQVKKLKKELAEEKINKKKKIEELQGKIDKQEKQYEKIYGMYKNLERRSIVCWIKKLYRKMRVFVKG
jgi:lipopolysaccharide biosynthesis glycosyltransferase